jgi:hypothetical protein
VKRRRRTPVLENETRGTQQFRPEAGTPGGREVQIRSTADDSRNDSVETISRIDQLKFDPDALSVVDAEPAEAYPGTAMIITGNNFSAARFGNIVEAGGKPGPSLWSPRSTGSS